MTVLVHNTTHAYARRILAQRRLIANVEFTRPYGANSGPFFCVQGQDGSEIPSGGRRHGIDLFFECPLPLTEPLKRGDIVRAIANGAYGHLRGHVVVGTNDVSGMIEQAIIIPDEWACLNLIRAEPWPGLLAWVARRSAVGPPFDVLLPSTACKRRSVRR